uniref:ATP-dependent Clp protease proteolytic subunit n=1 Tax=Ananas comosus var. bracteatus TaxID=296719 RepID=A0A6V7PQS1_ANACO|nr:unnamed protein product [Ananas comosus var. bracteatus]
MATRPSPLPCLHRNPPKTLPLSFHLHLPSSSPSPRKGKSLKGGFVSPKRLLRWILGSRSSSEEWALVYQGRSGGAVVAVLPGGGAGRAGTPANGAGAVPERHQPALSACRRIIRCGGAVDDDMANIIVAQLLYLDAVDPTKDIVMYVNSPGGSVTAGMAIFDTMRHIRPDVSTVCVGLAASMGAFILSSGTKGKRYSLPNSRIMIHQPLGGAQGGQTDIDIQANEMLHHKANLNGYLAYHTGQPLEKINQDTDRDFFMSAKEAKEYGLIDGVIMNPLKALQPLPASEQ